MFLSPFVAIFRKVFFFLSMYYKDTQTNVQISNIKFYVCDSQYKLQYKIQVKLFVLHLCV